VDGGLRSTQEVELIVSESGERVPVVWRPIVDGHLDAFELEPLVLLRPDTEYSIVVTLRSLEEPEWIWREVRWTFRTTRERLAREVWTENPPEVRLEILDHQREYPCGAGRLLCAASERGNTVLVEAIRSDGEVLAASIGDGVTLDLGWRVDRFEPRDVCLVVRERAASGRLSAPALRCLDAVGVVHVPEQLDARCEAGRVVATGYSCAASPGRPGSGPAAVAGLALAFAVLARRRTISPC
jgi:hypothetical protein